MIEVALLSILQGVAEFLPISSSGHLVIGQHFLGMNQPGLRLDLMLHVGTLFSIFVFYGRAIWAILRRWDWRFMLKIVISALPAVAVYFLFRREIEGLFENARMVGALLMFTGAVLIGTRYLPRGTLEVSWGRAILMGLGQALALLPGVSRSGMTLAAARSGRVDPEKSAEFSFLMSAPLIVGGVLLEVVGDLVAGSKAEMAVSVENQISWWLCIYGAVISAIVGYFSLKLLVKALKGRWFWLFGLYCLGAGLLTLILV